MSTTNSQQFSDKWKTKRLGDIVSIRNQKVMPSNVNANMPCVELEHIGSGDGQLLESSTAEYSTSLKYRFLAGDVLFGRLRSYLRKFWLADCDGICTTEIWPLIVDTEQIDSRFLHAIVQSDQFIAMANLSYGTHMPRADWGVMRNFPVMLPEIQEQRAIAEVLSDVDGLLNALETLIAKKQAIKQAVMQQLLTGKTRLPGFSGAWEMKRLGEIGTFAKGRGIKRDDVSDEGLPCVRYGELYTRYQDYILKVTSRIPPSIAATALPIKTGDLLFAGSGETAEEIGRCAAYLGEEQAYAGGDVIVLTPSGHNSIYLGHLMNSSIVSAQKARMGQGDAVVHIYINNLAQVQMELPSITEQNAIASVLSDMDAEIAVLEQRRDKTRAIKQGMMQQLLTGRVRLSESRICTDDTD